MTNYKSMKLQIDENGLICNPDFEVLQNSEIIDNNGQNKKGTLLRCAFFA